MDRPPERVKPSILKRRWLKWTLVGIGMFLMLVLAAIALLVFYASRPSRVETISDHWVLEHYNPWNVDGYHSKYLARRGTITNKTVSTRILDFLYIADDCVIYSDHDNDLYGVCGEHPPVYVTTFGDDNVPDLRHDIVVFGDRQYHVADIKGAAQDVSEERVGGGWSAQREAFPDSLDPQDIPHFVLFREERHRRRIPMPVLAYRYIGHDCLLYVYPTVMLLLFDPAAAGGSHEYPVAAACGNRYEAYLGTVPQPADISLGEAIQVRGKSTSLGEIRRRAQSEREFY